MKYYANTRVKNCVRFLTNLKQITIWVIEYIEQTSTETRIKTVSVGKYACHCRRSPCSVCTATDTSELVRLVFERVSAEVDQPEVGDAQHPATVDQQVVAGEAAVAA